MARQLSILNIGGHPKDLILYAGGTLALHVERGDRVCQLVTTNGLSQHYTAVDNYSGSKKAPNIEQLVEERRQEAIDASAEVGVTDVRFLGYDDVLDLPDRGLAADIADVIGDVRPDVVITHWPYDTVPAHANATQMALLAISAASGIRNQDHPPHAVKQIFYHTQQGYTNAVENLRPHQPTTVIDITTAVDKKSNAMNRFTSQYYGEGSNLWQKLANSLDGGILALHSRIPFAETFIASRPQIYLSLPMSEYGLELAEKSEIEGYEYQNQILLDPH